MVEPLPPSVPAVSRRHDLVDAASQALMHLRSVGLAWTDDERKADEVGTVMFPRLRTRRDARGENLSGGERQMLAIARALMAPQKLMLLDEPFEGLAPAVVAEVLAAVERLRERTSILLVEHKIDLVLHLAERTFVMVNGQIAFAGASATLQHDLQLQQRLLGVGT
jgi:branched-chain amino acid transport system ATP-binding protein